MTLQQKHQRASHPPNSLQQGSNTLLFGISQIFFQGKAISGLLILAAFAVTSWQMAILVVIGSVCSSLTGRLMGVPVSDVRNGLQGFCGALVGAAAYSALGGEWLGIMSAVLGGIACAPVTWALVKAFSTRPLKIFNLPYVTAPFCIVAGLMLLATTGHHIAAPAGVADDSVQTALFRSLLTNISEVLLMNDVVAGGLVLLALFVAHWKVGLAAVLGSVLQSIFVLLLRQDIASLSSGVFGYSGVLVAIAMAAVFLKGTWQPWVMAVLGALLACLLTLLIQHLPGVYTWPFVITTWVLLAISRFIPGITRA